MARPFANSWTFSAQFRLPGPGCGRLVMRIGVYKLTAQPAQPEISSRLFHGQSVLKLCRTPQQNWFRWRSDENHCFGRNATGCCFQRCFGLQLSMFGVLPDQMGRTCSKAVSEFSAIFWTVSVQAAVQSDWLGLVFEMFAFNTDAMLVKQLEYQTRSCIFRWRDASAGDSWTLAWLNDDWRCIGVYTSVQLRCSYWCPSSFRACSRPRRPYKRRLSEVNFCSMILNTWGATLRISFPVKTRVTADDLQATYCVEHQASAEDHAAMRGLNLASLLASRDFSDRTALHCAAQGGHPEARSNFFPLNNGCPFG